MGISYYIDKQRIMQTAAYQDKCLNSDILLILGCGFAGDGFAKQPHRNQPGDISATVWADILQIQFIHYLLSATGFIAKTNDDFVFLR